MDEDRSPASAHAPAPPSEVPDSLAAIVPKRRLWPVFAVLGLIVAVVGGVVYRELTATDPLRILVAIDLDGYWWEGSVPAAKLADALASQLAELGFDPVKGGDPKVMKVLEHAKDLEAAAKQLGAGFVIQAHLSPEVVDHPVKGGYTEVRVDAPVKLTFLDKGTSSESQIHGFAGGTKKDSAMAYLADSLATQALDAVIGQLLDHPAVVEITSGSDVKLLERLAPARVFGKERTKRLAESVALYAAAAKEREDAGKGRVTFHSSVSADDGLVGVAPGGYFVKTADVTPFFSLRHRVVGRIEALETVSFRSFDALAVPTTDPSSPAPMWRGYHVFTYPSSQPDGDRVVFVEDLFGWAKTITVAGRQGAAKRVRVDPEHRFVDPRLAPGGRFVAAYDRAAPGAPANVLVLDTTTGREVFAYHPDTQLGGLGWIDATRLVFSSLSENAKGDGHVILVDCGKDPITIERPLRIESGKDLFMPSASSDGKLLAWALSSAMPGVAVVDTTTWAERMFPVEAGASWPMFSPDGAHVVFETRGAESSDIGAVVLASGAVKKVVDTRNDERLPRFSADGKRVLFEVRYPDPVFPRARSLSRIASVAFEP